MIKVRTKAAGAVLAGAALMTGLGAGEAMAAASAPSEFQVSGSDGVRAGYSNGSVTFYERSAKITGTVKSHTKGCVRVEFVVFSRGQVMDVQYRTACGLGPGSSKGFNFTSPALKGGVSEVRIDLEAVEASGATLRKLDKMVIKP
ncbi:hypothetical protein ACFYT4_31675 [Streptomyces sp. NPDC004609]|uniref:hypothetical protein n=1 Tax=Streptomyces sp. NPDC004609 TaxID=3364704 RepID=UPI0036D10756